jgi:hypothetical protein
MASMVGWHFGARDLPSAFSVNVEVTIFIPQGISIRSGCSGQGSVWW